MAAISLDPNVKRTLSVEEFCEVAEVCRSTGYAGVKDGSVPSIRIGGRIRIPTAAVRRMLQLDDVASDAA